jgi:hypothetical protein
VAVTGCLATAYMDLRSIPLSFFPIPKPKQLASLVPSSRRTICSWHLRMAHQLYTPTEYNQRLLTNPSTMGYYKIYSHGQMKKTNLNYRRSASHKLFSSLFFFARGKLFPSMFGSVLERLFLVHDFAVDLASASVPTRTRLAEYHDQKDWWEKNCRCSGRSGLPGQETSARIAISRVR